MRRYKLFIFLIIILGTLGVVVSAMNLPDDRFVSYTAGPKDIKLFYKDEAGKNFGSLQNLKTRIESKGQKLSFAMNGGMYKPDHSPQGLYIEDGKVLSPADTAKGSGNFYLEPNGVFYITSKNNAMIGTTPEFIDNGEIKYATQSGPMLVIDGAMHPAFRKGSANLQIRNAVGILPDGTVHFAMSKGPINFYDLAEYFIGLGCKNALYLDGFVSRTYLPEEGWLQTDGNFGVIIGIVK